LPSAKLSCAKCFSVPVAAFGVEMFKAICKLGLEGIVSKKLNAPYKSGPSKAWLKIKNPEAPAATRAIEALFEPRIYSEFMNSTGGARVIVSTNLGMDRSVILVETAHSNKDLEVKRGSMS
jgi:hypothetical protein